jgi:hypothetical protein
MSGEISAMLKTNKKKLFRNTYQVIKKIFDDNTELYQNNKLNKYPILFSNVYLQANKYYQTKGRNIENFIKKLFQLYPSD